MTNLSSNGLPRMYRDLAWLFPIITPPEDYITEAGQFASLIRQYARIEARTLLDLGCGAGHNDHTLQKYFQVTGMDISEEMLSLARRLNPGSRYLIGDMRSVRLESRFDAVLIADSISYMLTEVDLRAAFETAFWHLNPGGVFCTYAEDHRENFVQNGTYISTHTQGDVEVALVQNNYDPDPTDTTFEMTFVYLIRRTGALTIETDRHRLGIFPLQTWVELLRDVGFEVRQIPFEGQNFPQFIGIKPL